MQSELIYSLTSTFEGHAQQTDDGTEYWLARDIQPLLGYSRWENFLHVIEKAKTACQVSVYQVSDHFADVTKTIQMPKSAQKELSQVIFEQTGGNQDFALIRSKGDHALFSKSTQAMKAHWKVPDSRPLADFAPTIILKAKDFAAEITIFNARQHQMASEGQISQEHITNNAAVRNTLLERGIRPESLPPAEDVKKVERRLITEEKKSTKAAPKLKK